MSRLELPLERVVKGFANHRRIEMLRLLERQAELSLEEIAERLRINMKTASEHMKRLSIGGLVRKRYEGRHVRHALSPTGQQALTFLRSLK